MNTKNDDISETSAWADDTHAKVFDYLHKMPAFIVKRHYETFNEGRLLKKYKEGIKGNNFFEIGCATGELYRYISNYMSEFNYHGFDISTPAIERARFKYPQGDFHLLENDINEIIDKYGRPDIVWCRDVVLHQNQPFEFLNSIINLSKTASILRLRTRDTGATVFESKYSCQLHWDKHWVPYIVLNIEELVKHITKNKSVNLIEINRSYEVLGGQNYRFLPKELYFTKAGTSETAIYVQKGERVNGKVEILYSDKQDRPKLGYLERVVRKASLLFT